MKMLKLGNELTKNEQKKVLGGYVQCTNGHVGWSVSCSSGPAYCQYGFGSSMAFCY